MENKNSSEFKSEYAKLNKSQKEAVNTIDGPVMVVAGPGTGKTQVLALRIGYILSETDITSDSILCLTFTNSAVKAMRERLRKYIGAEASKVKVATFHGFGLEILEKYHQVLGLDRAPALMDEKDTIGLADDILHGQEWTYIRPRSDATKYFRDLRSLISILKRERITPEDFEKQVSEEINNLKVDPESISSRGESKGKIKKDIEKKIEGLERTIEAVKFYRIYEDKKIEKNLFDYDDILESLIAIMEESEEARDYVKETYLYVLIDEHQDSSGVQNEFLQKVWGDVEKPNIFVVGDDRQLIYGFGGASLEYFENFKNTFGKARLITLSENYRSTERILNASHALLQSSITKEQLISNHEENHPLRLVEAFYPRDEIIAAGLEIKDKIKKGSDANDMVILVPKNRQVRSAITILRDIGVPVASGESMNFFDSKEGDGLIRVLKVIANPNDGVALGMSFFDELSGIPPLKAHEFIKGNKMREFSLVNVAEEKNTLFDEGSEVNIWLGKLKSWLMASNDSLYSFVQKVGTEFLLDTAKNHEELVLRIEVVRTMLHLVLMQTENNPKLTLSEFLEFIGRVEEYGEAIPLAVFGANDGVNVLTLHGSKGLEFDYVWIAHMDERSFTGGKVSGFTVPESVADRIEEKDEEVLKRQLYVALTRAKRFCTISYALKSYTGADQKLASIVEDIADNFEKQTAEETEKIILKTDTKAYVVKEVDKENEERSTNLENLIKLVARDYEDRKVSVSLLNNFFECPWKWYFRSLLQLPEPKSPSLEFGNAVHESVDKILRLGRAPSTKDLEDLHVDSEVMKIISRWVENRLPEIKTDRENEKSVSVSDARFPHLSIYGKVDLIERLSPNELRVTDFKTGSIRKKSDIEKMDEEGRMSGYLRQLAMYSYLLENNSKSKVAVRESRLEFLEAKNEKEAFYDRAISSDEIELLVKDITDYDQLVKNGLWTTRPCNYNSYGKNAECEYCKMAEIYR